MTAMFLGDLDVTSSAFAPAKGRQACALIKQNNLFSNKHNNENT